MSTPRVSIQAAAAGTYASRGSVTGKWFDGDSSAVRKVISANQEKSNEFLCRHKQCSKLIQVDEVRDCLLSAAKRTRRYRSYIPLFA